MIGRLKQLAAGVSFAAAMSMASAALAETIEFWSFLDPAGEGTRSATIKHVLDTFKAANAGTEVNTNIIQWDELSASLLRAAQSGQTPDLVMLYSPNLPAHVAAGSVMSLNSCLGVSSAKDLDDLIVLGSAIDSNGNILGVPWELRLFGIIYRSDLLSKAGLPVPQSFDEMVEAAKRFTAEGYIGLGMAFSPARSVEAIEWFLPMAVGMGAKVLNEDGTAAFNSPEVVFLLNRLHAAVHDDKVVPLDLILSSSEDPQQMAESGRVVFFSEGSHRVSTVREKSGPGIEWSFMPSPGIKSGTTSPANLQGWHLVIPASAKHPEAACKLIKHWVSPDIQRYQTLNAGYMPVLKSLGTDPALSTPENAYVGVATAYAASNPLTFNWPENSDVLNKVLGDMIVRVLADQMSAEDAIAAAEQEYNDHVR